MARQKQYTPLRVLLNNNLVGLLSKEPGGHISFQYDESWLARENAIPVSLSLPLREDAHKGAPVAAVFENLLPDSAPLRQRVAEKVGAAGTDSYSLLSRIGRDCVGALQFIPDGESILGDPDQISGEAINDGEIEAILKNLSRAPLGLGEDQEFRISVAGAQEKTALLFYEGRWLKPHGVTPTTHIFKTQMGRLPNGLDLTNSIDNEYYCLKLMAAFGLPVNKAEMHVFGETKALVVERFDRKWTKDGRLLRLPQEDCCQALSVPPTQKYQNEGGPGMVEILNLLKGSNQPAQDQKIFIKAQILFWLIGATDGHAKNFSIYLGPAGRFYLTPLYDILTAQPSVDARQLLRKQMKLAISVGNKSHYVIDYIQGRHFIQTVERAGLPRSIASDPLDEIAKDAERAFQIVASRVQGDAARIHESVHRGFMSRLPNVSS